MKDDNLIMLLFFLFLFLPMFFILLLIRYRLKSIPLKCKCGNIFSFNPQTIRAEITCPECKSLLSVKDNFWSCCIRSDRQHRPWTTFLTVLLILTVSLVVGVTAMRSPVHRTRPFEDYDYDAATIDVGPAFLAAATPELIVNVTTHPGRILQRLSLNVPTNAIPLELYVRTEDLPRSYTTTWSKSKHGNLYTHSIPEETMIFRARITDPIPSSSFPVRITVAVANPEITGFNEFKWKNHEATYNYSLDGINRGLVERYRITVVVSALSLLALVFVMGLTGIMPLSRMSLLLFPVIVVTAVVGGLLGSLTTLPSRPNVSEISECMQGVATGFFAWIFTMFLGFTVAGLIRCAIDKVRVKAGTLTFTVTSCPPKS